MPTLFHGPGFENRGTYDGLVSLIDLPPTLLDAAGLRSCHHAGAVYPRAGHAGLPGEDVFIQISESHVARALRTRRWKYEVEAPGQTDGTRWRVRAMSSRLLYDLDADPHELTNLMGLRSTCNRAELRQCLLGRIAAAGEEVAGVRPHEDQASRTADSSREPWRRASRPLNERSMGQANSPMRKAPTMADVARHANVSTAAVSYFLSGDNLRLKRVEQTRESESSRRSPTSIMCRTARPAAASATGGADLPDFAAPRRALQRPHCAGCANGGERARAIDDHCGGSRLQDVERIFLEIESGLADALIAELQHLTAVEMEGLTRRLAVARKPMIVFHPTVQPNQFSVLRQDAANAIGEACGHFMTQGIGALPTCSTRLLGEKTRVNAYLTFLKFAGLPLRSTRGRWRRIAAIGPRDRSRPAEVGKRPTALFAESDFAAITALNTFRACRVEVPLDIAVVGCGNIDEGQFSYPRLSTIGPESATFSHLAHHVADLIAGKRISRSKVFELPWSVIQARFGLKVKIQPALDPAGQDEIQSNGFTVAPPTIRPSGSVHVSGP